MRKSQNFMLQEMTNKFGEMGSVRETCKKYFFCVRVVDDWSKMTDMVKADSTHKFKKMYDD